jgi:nucleotide-binding universal stress UspA family protein
MLVAVFEEPLVILPDGMDWSGLRKQARKTLAETRVALAPDARTCVEGDLSVARALGRVVRRDHRDLLVVGSSRHAREGRVRIGKRTRQLLCHFDAPLAIAPRGMRSREEIAFRRIGVGYDGGPEARGALAFAAELAKAADAELYVRTAVDDRMPAMGWDRAWLGDLLGEWQQALKNEQEELRRQAIEIGTNHGARVIAEAVAGRPANALLQLSESVDLLVIGSRRWGPAARVLLGSTGEALLHDAGCPVVAVPRPDEPQD